MLFQIENEFLRATFSSRGAELQSLILKTDGTEYIWQADPEVWPNHAPLLFPFIGRLKDGEYTHEGTCHQITMHGFGRDSEFTVLKKGEKEITFLLTPNELSKKMYPYLFELQIHYVLDGNTLKKEHTVRNRDKSALYYELGGHDAYNICLEDQEVMEDYYIDFGKLEELHSLCLDENVLITKDSCRIPLADGTIALSMELFDMDTLILHRIPVKEIAIRSRKSAREIRFAFPDFPTLGIWTKNMGCPARFVCLEPWSSLPDCAYLGKELKEKVDIRKVEPGEMETLAFSVTVK